MFDNPILAVTPGDPDGIGPEILAKTLRSKKLPSRAILLCFASESALRRARTSFKVLDSLPSHSRELVALSKKFKTRCFLVAAPETAPDPSQLLPGFQSGWAIEAATRAVQAGLASALVTGPISKSRLNAGGYAYPGHTEFLAALCGAPEVTMMLANDQLRVALVTTHVALKDVSKVLTRPMLRRAILQTIEALQNWWGIRSPKIAVSALNPHAGEGGLFGTEEQILIGPELDLLRSELGRSAKIEGPLPADTLFAQHREAKKGAKYDAVVCLYHDQGLIPVKLLDFAHTVNITLGLPILRTSVDHGVAFDIAGKGIADPSSFQSALALAMTLTKSRRRA